MALDPRKRQKKLERKKAKEKKRSTALASRQPQNLAQQFRQLATGPFVHCEVPDGLWDDGIGQVIVARQVGASRVAYAVFLVDVFCLGVKNVYYGIAARAVYEAKIYRKLTGQFRSRRWQPECVCKLVEQAVEYARSVGLPPHEDYAKAAPILAGVDVGGCERQFEFGREGKPFFISGPNDSPAKCERILATLRRHRGVDNFDYLVHVGSGPAPSLHEGLLAFGRLADSPEDEDESAPLPGLIDEADDEEFAGEVIDAESRDASDEGEDCQPA